MPEDPFVDVPPLPKSTKGATIEREAAVHTAALAILCARAGPRFSTAIKESGLAEAADKVQEGQLTVEYHRRPDGYVEVSDEILAGEDSDAEEEEADEGTRHRH